MKRITGIGWFGWAVLIGAFIWFYKKAPGGAIFIGAIFLAGIPVGMLVKKAQAKYDRKKAANRYWPTGYSGIDNMTGEEFELWCGNLLRKNGFQNIRYTPSTGDQGVDIVADRDGCRYAVQCKRYSGPVGNSPVQEVLAGKAVYGCDRCIVMTNSTFTDGAKQLASANGVILWDRYRVSRMAHMAQMASRARTEGTGQENIVRPASNIRTERDEWDDLFDFMSIMEDDED